MDANGLRFWMLAAAADWQLDDPAAADVDYDATRDRLRLRSERDRALPAGLESGAQAEAVAALARVPEAVDAFGTRAAWDPSARAVSAAGVVPGSVAILELEPGTAPDDLAVGDDGVLYLTADGSVRLHDLRGRWGDAQLRSDGFTAWRLAPDPAGGAWVIDRPGQRLGHVHGLPLPARPYAPASACAVRPCPENPDPPTLLPLAELGTAGARVVALACAPSGRLALLRWRDGEDAELLVQRAGGGPDISIRLAGIRFPYTLAWISETAVATRVPRLDGEALVYDIGDALAAAEAAGIGPGALDGAPSAVVQPVGDVYPVRGALAEPFAHVLSLPPRYPTPDGTAPLRRLSAPAYAPAGIAAGARPFDSGSTDTVWHRLYVEATIPPHCGMRVFLAATDEAAPPASAPEWHEHRFGAVAAGPRARTAAMADGRPVPAGAWVPLPSEIPFDGGLLGCPPQPGRSGLFTALVERSNRPVRALRGRYLWVRVQLLGDRRSTPELAALRCYASRFSYVEQYLPELYREQLFGAERDAVLPPDAVPATTAPDFLERFVANFEGVLTALEDRIAYADLLTTPERVPDASLEWLAAWIGVTFDPVYPAAQRRELLKAAAHLFRERGTLAGLTDALGLATGGRFTGGGVLGGGVLGGEIVILENFRLRRTFATILGAHLTEEQDPLLAGLSVSGNSYLGDTLILGDEDTRDFLALFGADAAVTAAESAAVADFFARQANQITVLVHQDVEPQDLGLIRRIVELEKPAHVAASVVAARYPLLVGAASLVGVDTYLAPPIERQPVRIGQSALGADYLLGLPALDPRLVAGRRALPPLHDPPTAVADAPATVLPGASFTLDASRSSAAPDHAISSYHWSWLR